MFMVEASSMYMLTTRYHGMLVDTTLLHVMANQEEQWF